MVAESETSAFRLAAWSTAINVLVASGFATAGSSLRGRSCRPAPGSALYSTTSERPSGRW